MLIYCGNLPKYPVIQGTPTVPVIHNWRLDASGGSDNPPTVGVVANIGVCGHVPDSQCEECPKYHDCDIGNPCLVCTIMEYPCPWV